MNERMEFFSEVEPPKLSLEANAEHVFVKKKKSVLTDDAIADYDKEGATSTKAESGDFSELNALREKISEALPVLKLEEEVWKRTNGFENEIERERESVPAKINPLSKKVVRFVKKSFHSIILGGALLGGSSRVDADSISDVRKISVFESREVGRKNLTDREWQNKIGLKLNAISKANGFSCATALDNGAKRFILHIGQTHKTPFNFTNETQKLQVLMSQKSIAGFISSIIAEKPSATNVFTEGLTVEGEKISNEIRSTTKELLDLIQPDRDCYKKIRYAHSSVMKMAETDSPKLYTHLNYLFQKKIKFFDDYFKNYGIKFVDNEREKTTFQKEREMAYQIIAPISQLKNFGLDAIYYYGGDEKLFLDGKTFRKAAETDATNQAPFEYDKIIERLSQQLSKARDVNAVAEISRRIQEVSAVAKKTAFDDREDEAIKIISTFARTNTATIIPLVFGSRHDFRDNVIKWNKSHPDKRFGLIVIALPSDSASSSIKHSAKK